MYAKKKLEIKQRGITLIALVITIIILLILAAVTIAALSGDNGILSNATRAKKETERAEIVEQIRLDIYGKMASDNGTNPTEADIEQIADNYGDISGSTFADKVLTTDKEKYEIKLSDIWTSEISTSEEPNTPEETPPEDTQEAIEIVQSNWDISTAQTNIDGYYLIKNDCTISDSKGTEISSTGDIVLQIDNNVQCTIEGETSYNGNIKLKPESILTTYAGIFKRNVEIERGAKLIANGGTFAENININSGASAEISGGTFAENININSGASAEISGGIFLGNLNIEEGGTLTISGGMFTINPEEYVVEGSRIEESNGIFSVLPN